MHWLNPDHLPHVTSRVERFLLNPDGEADGMILASGLEVHFPPHLAKEICAAIRSGDQVTAYGVQPRAAEMMAAVAIETKDGQRIVDNGPPEKPHHAPHHEKKRDKSEATGIIQRLLHGPKGETRGVLLEDGVIVRFPPHAVEAFSKLLAAGTSIAVRGEGLTTEWGTVVAAKEMGTSLSSVQPIPPKKPKHDKPPKHAKHPKHDKPGKHEHSSESRRA
jgi:hypothetical protein